MRPSDCEQHHPAECPGAEVLTGDTTDVFCANSNFLLKAEGAQGGCEDTLPEDCEPFELRLEVYDAVNGSANNFALQDTWIWCNTSTPLPAVL